MEDCNELVTSVSLFRFRSACSNSVRSFKTKVFKLPFILSFLVFLLSSEISESKKHERETLDLKIQEGNTNANEAVKGKQVLGKLRSSRTDDFFNLEGELSPLEYTKLRNNIDNHPEKNKFLIGWPTIPVSYKGSDSRALDTIKFLGSAGFEVDLIFWRDFATELGHPYHNDKPDRQKLADVGIKRIYGPYDKVRLSESNQVSLFSDYFAFIFWIWPDGPYLECVHDFVNYIKTLNGSTRIIAAVDDIGVAVRLLYSMDMRKENPENKNMSNIENFLLVNKRHPDLLGSEADDFDKKQPPPVTFRDGLYSPIYLFHLEMYLYAMADVSIGLNDHIVTYLEKMVPGTPARRLSYLSSAQPDKSIAQIPFEERRDYLFFGYQNTANSDLLHWFHEFIFHQINSKHKFHIVGMVTLSAAEFCQCSSSHQNDCAAKYENVICHGPISDEKLETLIRNAIFTMNTVLEPSGVATKTCRALAFGTPTVVSDLDGTLDGDKKSNSGAKICRHADHSCVIESINAFLNDENEWNEAAALGPRFITAHYGSRKFIRDWAQILDVLYEKKFEILIYGDAKYDGGYFDANNWHMANMLKTITNFKITVLGDMYPIINGVSRVDMPSEKSKRLPRDKLGGFFSIFGHSSFESPFQTGFQANVVLRHTLPTENIFPLKFCGVGCRVTQMLSLDFGSIPSSLLSPLAKNADWLWVSSQYVKNVHQSFFPDSDRISILDEGIDCESILSAEIPNSRKEDQVVFIFIGDLIPRKGVDIIIDQWRESFCLNTQVHLKLYTNYEMGFERQEIVHMEKIEKKCNNFSWIRKTYLSSKDRVAELMNADIYLAPFRSEGSVSQLIEAMSVGLSVVTSLGDTAADHNFIYDFETTSEATLKHPKVYPVSSQLTICNHFPCVGDALCIFPPCSNYSSSKEVKCRCEHLAGTPTWLEINRDDLRYQMTQAFDDKIDERFYFGADFAEHDDTQYTKYCWSNLSTSYEEKILSIIKQRRIRQVQEYEIIRPRDRKQVHGILKLLRFFCFFAASLILLVKKAKSGPDIWQIFPTKMWIPQPPRRKSSIFKRLRKNHFKEK